MEDFFLLTAKALLYPRTIRGFYNTKKACSCSYTLSFCNCFKLLSGVLDVCLSRRKSCDRYSEGRAGNVVKADGVAELD